MSLVFIGDNGGKTPFTQYMFESIMSDPLHDASFEFKHDDKGAYLLINSNKGRLEVRSEIKTLSKNELYEEFEKAGITDLPFSIEFEHLYS